VSLFVMFVVLFFGAEFLATDWANYLPARLDFVVLSFHRASFMIRNGATE
jgi:hypothetical protein